MKIEHEVINSKNIINITITGDFDFKIIKERIGTIYHHPGQTRKYKVLLDLRNVECEFNLFEIYGLVKYLGPRLRKFIGKVAVLVSNEHEFKRAIIIGLFLNNRGFNIKVFSNPDEVNNWLDVSICEGNTMYL